MPEITKNLELQLKLFYKDCLLDTKFVERNKPFIIGHYKRLFWQILGTGFPQKHTLVTFKKAQNYKINLPPKAKIEELKKNDILLDKEEKEKITKRGSFIIDYRFSGTIILNSNYKIKFLFAKKPVIDIPISPEYKKLLRRQVSIEDRRVVNIFSILIIVWAILCIITESITLPEKAAVNIEAIEYAAQITVPPTTEEEAFPPVEINEGAEGEGEGVGPAGEAKGREKTFTYQEQVSQATKAFTSQMFASIGGIGTTGKIATGVTISPGTAETGKEAMTVADITSSLASGKVIAKTNIPVAKGAKVKVVSGGGGKIEGEIVEAGKAEKLLRIGHLQKAKITHIKGSARARTVRKKTDLLQVISSYSGGLKFVHSEMLKKYPDLFGKIYFTIIIDEDGNIRTVNIVEGKSTIHNPEFENRILQKIRSWHFPKIAKGFGTISFEYPLIFTR